MKWRLAFIVCSYVIGVGFLVAWQIEAEERLLNPPGGVVNPNSIKRLLATGCAFISIGTIAFTHLIADKIRLLCRASRSRDATENIPMNPPAE